LVRLGLPVLVVSFPTRLVFVLLAAALTTNNVGCNGSMRTLTPAQRGEALYRTNCSSCHGSDPNRAGALGPAIAGSPRALIEARILHRSYPAGYEPKRHPHLMQAMPWMGGHIDDLTAYLALPSRSEADR
jgi:mono/diheme cytochrome c family protein